ncbi:hypothetical protein ACQ4PT_024560 [Festuca glaucescens]
MAPSAAAALPGAATTTWSTSANAARPAPTASSQSPSRRTVPGLLVFFSLAALLILSSGDDAAAYEAATSERPLKDVSLEHPEVTFALSSIGGKFCERIRVSGIPRNVSMGLCECEAGEWQVLQDGMWNAVKSPYGSKYVDVKLADKKSTAFSLSIQEELQKWRLACLGIGFVLLFMSPIVSKWAPFYYSSSMALGILLVVLIVLFQGMKLLPMGKKSVLYLTIYGSVLGVGSYAVHYFSTLVASILENFGLSEEMHNPVSIFLVVAVVLTGAGFGYWMVRRFIISKDRSVDAGIAQFVKWAMRVVAIFFITQVAKAINDFFFSKVYSSITQHPPGLPPSTLARRVAPNQDEDYYSTFHNIEPRKYSKREWEDFTKESTRNELMKHTATPEFAQWAADNAHRLRVERDDASEDKTIESSSSSSKETEEVDKASGLLRWF